MNGLSARAVAELRHELRTPLNLIIGYGDAPRKVLEAAGRRAMLEQTLATRREPAFIDQRGGAAVPGRDQRRGVRALRDSLREPHGRISAATSHFSPRGRRAQTRSLIATVRRVRTSAAGG